MLFLLLFTFSLAQNVPQNAAPAVDPSATPALTTAAPDPIETERTPTHQVVRRIAVFPLATDDHKKEADAAWWSVREFLANSQRFLVATKRLMSQKDVFQSRKSIVPTDVILLAKVLDADCVISTFLNKNSLKMVAYSGGDGFPLWENSLSLNPSLPIGKQLEPLSAKLIRDFLASFPYHGFQIVDPLIGKSVFEEGDVMLAKIDIGAKAGVQIGEPVQWLTVERQNPTSLFQGGGLVKILAEGEVVKIDNQTALVEIKRVTDVKLLTEKSLISVPAEAVRLQSQFALGDLGRPKLSTLMLSSPMYPIETKSVQSRPLLTSLASVASLVALLLLAF